MTPKLTLGLGLVATLLAASVQAENLAIVGGTVHTVDSNETIANGVVLVSDGKILRVGGSDTQIPEGFRVVDATGQHVTPGLFSAFSTVGAEEISLESSTVNHTIDETFYNAGFEVAPGINPLSATIAVARAEGVTRAVVVPGAFLGSKTPPNKSIFAGQAAYIHLGQDMDLVIKADAAEMAYLESKRNAAGTARGAVLASLRGALKEALPRKGGAGGGKFIKSEADRLVLAKVANGVVPLYVEESRASFILQLLKLKKEFQALRLVIVGADEAWMVASEIAAAKAAVVITPDQNLPNSFTQLASTLKNASRLEAAGVTVAIFASNGLAHQVDLLRQNAGLAAAYGMSWEGALRAITINPAKIIGVEMSVGSLAAGKEADVVVWDGDPLEVMTLPTHVFIRGEEQALKSRQTELRDRYLNLKSATPPAYRK